MPVPRKHASLAAVAGVSMVASSLALFASPAHAADPVEINILGINDFHGRINANGTEAGAAVLAGAVEQIETAHPNTVFAAAGDLIGASTFESFISNDKPTIDALNEAGLDVSAAGNHEFDQGYDDLINRVMAPESEANPDGGAQWEYIAANVKMKDSGNPALDPSYVQTFGEGDSAVDVGFVGAVTEDLPSLVSPSGISEITVTDIATAVNEEATALKADGVEIIVLLVHEGAATPALADTTNPDTAFGQIVTGVNGDVDAIISGHTHQAYNHAVPVQEWVTEGRAVTTRPVVSAGQYGMNLNQLTYSVDPATGDVASVSTALLDLTPTPAFPADEAVAQIVAAANAAAESLGAAPLGEIGDPFYRARKADPAVENRGGESTLGNLVAEVQRWATRAENLGGAQIAFMNPGGLRQDMLGLNGEGYPATLTYKQAAVVQPFANTLINMDMTGAQIRTVLEQQWQRNADGTVPSRPFLKLGVSDGFEYTYDPAAPEGSKVQEITLNGEPLGADTIYSVTANSFLASGGDNFRAFSQATNKRDTGQVDLQAMVDYLDANASGSALQADYAQRAVGVAFPEGAPESYATGDTVALDLSSLAMTGPGDEQDESLNIRFNGQTIGTAAVDNSVTSELFDENGTSSVSVVLPRYAGDPDSLRVVGTDTGTRIDVPIATEEQAKAAADMSVQREPKRVVVDKTKTKIKVEVDSADEPATGKIEVRAGGKTYKAKLNDKGRAVVTLKPFARTGQKTVKVTYLGDKLTEQATQKLTFKVRKK